MTVSESTVIRMFRAHNLRRLDRPAGQRVTHSTRYAGSVPVHRPQVDDEFLRLKDQDGKAMSRFQQAAIDDAA